MRIQNGVALALLVGLLFLVSAISARIANMTTTVTTSTRRNQELTPVFLADYIQSLNLDPKLNGIFRPIFNAENTGNSPYDVGEQGLLPTELVTLLVLSALTGATPDDFDLSKQTCSPSSDLDRKFILDMVTVGYIGYQDFFLGQSILMGVEGVSAEAPGLCTTTYISHQAIHDGIADLPQLQVDDDIVRGNELGLFRLNDRTFEFCLDLLPENEWDFCKIVLGMPNADHEIIRPLMDTLWGDENPPGSIFSTSGGRWSKQTFVDSAKLFLEGKETLNLESDATFWTIKELHKQTLGVDLPDAQVQAFQNLRGISLLLAIMPEAFVDQIAEQFGTSVAAVNAGKRAFVDLYSVFLPSIFPELASDSVALAKASMAVLDGFLFAGGASVPSTIKNGLAAYYNKLTPKGRFSMTNPIDLGVLALETIRSYPPVLGFPYINKITGQRLAPLAGMAGYDRGVYGGDADKFRIRGDLNYYHDRSLNWADSALPVEGAPFSNHVCPARSMSYSMIVAFWEALDATLWCVDPNTPIVKESGPTFWSDFTIIKGDCGK